LGVVVRVRSVAVQRWVALAVVVQAFSRGPLQRRQPQRQQPREV
jgi:hypothetical protein